MRDRDREELRDLLRDPATEPISWDRVNAIARRRSILALCLLIAFALSLIMILVLTTVLGKSTIDSSFSPPILSHASVSMKVGQPRFGRGLTHFDDSGSGAAHSGEGDTTAGELGYRVKADLNAEGLKGEPLTARWRLIDSRGESSGEPGEVGRTTLRSNDEEVTLRQWVPRPPRSGIYVVAVSLWARNGEKVTSAESPPFFAVGGDCCAAYETKSYTATLPQDWRLEEDYAPNPGARYVTVARGPYGDALVIDTSPNQSGNALGKADELEGLLASSGEGYRRLDRKLRHNDHRLVVEWSYEIEGDAFTDILFYRGRNGYAVLGRSDRAHFRETRDLTRDVARSVKPVESP
jgi:hypothetical protein